MAYKPTGRRVGRPTKKEARYRNVGRPTVMTETVLEKLKEAWLNNSSDEVACDLAGISVDTLYKYQRENPKYIKQKETYKKNTLYQANKTMRNYIMGFSYKEKIDTGKVDKSGNVIYKTRIVTVPPDAKTALEFAKHKDPEFKSKTDVTIEDVTISKAFEKNTREEAKRIYEKIIKNDIR